MLQSYMYIIMENGSNPILYIPSVVPTLCGVVKVVVRIGGVKVVIGIGGVKVVIGIGGVKVVIGIGGVNWSCSAGNRVKKSDR